MKSVNRQFHNVYVKTKSRLYSNEIKDEVRLCVQRMVPNFFPSFRIAIYDQIGGKNENS